MAIGVNPTRHEIELQLERMLAHPLFQARELQAKIFRYVVKKSLNRRKVDELALFLRFYPKKEYDAKGSEVRTNVSYLRGLLQKYYDGDGADDPVIITLPAPERIPQPSGKYKLIKRPPDEAYRPEFSYNPRSQTAEHFALAEHFLRGTPSQFGDAIWHFNALLLEHPDHPEAVLGAIEVMGGTLIGPTYDKDALAKLIAYQLAWIETLEPATTDKWRIHNVRGLLYAAAGEFTAARKEFNVALRLDRQSTISRGLYIVFLVATGRAEEAARLQSVLAQERPSNANVQAFYAICLTKAKHYDEAKHVFMEALRLDRNCIAAHFGSAQLHLETGNRAKAEEQLKRLKPLVEPSEYEHLKKRLGIKTRRSERSV